MRWASALLIVAALTGLGAGPAGDAEVPERYMKADEIKALLDMKQRLWFLDVRNSEQYDILHIKGAVNIPLDQLPKRLAEVSREQLIVIY